MKCNCLLTSHSCASFFWISACLKIIRWLFCKNVAKACENIRSEVKMLKLNMRNILSRKTNYFAINCLMPISCEWIFHDITYWEQTKFFVFSFVSTKLPKVRVIICYQSIKILWLSNICHKQIEFSFSYILFSRPKTDRITFTTSR